MTGELVRAVAGSRPVRTSPIFLECGDLDARRWVLTVDGAVYPLDVGNVDIPQAMDVAADVLRRLGRYDKRLVWQGRAVDGRNYMVMNDEVPGMPGPMTDEQANAVWDVLVEFAGANGWQRDEFVFTQTRGRCDEFRFIGHLGFGGKFWRSSGRWYVTAYPEDITPERQASIDTTNNRLVELLQEHGG